MVNGAGRGGADGTVGTRGPDLDVLLQPPLLALQLAAALLLLAHTGLQLRHHQLKLLLAGRQPSPGLLGLGAQLSLCSQLLCQVGTLLFQLGVGEEAGPLPPGTSCRPPPGFALLFEMQPPNPFLPRSPSQNDPTSLWSLSQATGYHLLPHLLPACQSPSPSVPPAPTVSALSPPLCPFSPDRLRPRPLPVDSLPSLQSILQAAPERSFYHLTFL